MNAEDSLKLARRFIGLPLEKRQLFLQALQKEGVDFSRFPIPAGVEVEDRQALSYAQQRMWFLWQLDPASGAYNLPGAVRLKGALNLDAMEQAFASLVVRHETLRTVFQRQADERLLQVATDTPLTVEHDDLSHLAPAEREQAVDQAATRQSLLPFDLENGPLLRVQLLKLDAQEHVLLLTLHHIVSDGWSMNVLIDEFIRLYDAHERNQTPQLPALPIQYSDYALWQRRWLEAGEQARQLEYWQARLGDEHPVLELPTDRPRPAMPSYQGTRHNFAIDPQLAAQLRACAQQHNVTLFMLLLGAFNVLLHRYTGQGDIRVGVPIANRNRTEVEGLIGFFVNTQVLRTELTGQTLVTELLQGIKEHALGAQAHQELPFERLVEALKVERSLSHTPLFQVMYNHQPVVADIANVSTASGLALALVEWQGRTTQFDLTLDTYEKSGTLHAALTYANDLFDAPTIERMAGHWISLLRAMVADGGQRIGELPMLAADEQQVLVHTWNQTAEAYPTERGIHHLIEDQVHATPDAPALAFGATTLTYAQLDARANQLAHALREQGVGPDVLVGICVERSIEMVVGLLAILKAGGAYVPLDPEYPRERLAYMIEDSGIQLLLSQQRLLPSLPVASLQVIALDQPALWLDGYSSESPAVAIQALNLAYVIYTSGSTGKPKGAGNSHRALVNRLCWMQQAYGLDASDAVLQKTPFSFDVSVWEFFWPLMAGARLVVAAPGEHREPARLIETIGQHGITTLHFVPSMLQAFIHEPGVQACGSLQRIVCSGEALPLDAQLQVFAKLPRAGLFNLYGPTEAAIDVTHWTCIDEGADSVPIGRPIANLGTYVLDAQLNPVAAGVSGELYLGGTGLARSYHRRPALTAERFVPSPFGDGARLYRTGDRVRQRADGVIDYLGRLDHQVKLRGLRIELGEIEARLMQHPSVREAVVLVQGGKQLVAYLVLEAQAPADLKAWLLSSLPEYMVPTHMVPLAKLPVTANGKLDRKALPLPDAAPQQAYIAPQNDLQKALAAIWGDVLGVEQVGLDDNFFELGGDSIISIQVVSRARQAGIRLSPRDLFQYQSVRSLALVAGFEQATVIDQGPVSGEVILTPVQHSFFEQAIPARQHWNQSLLLTPREALEPARLDAALTRLINHHDALRLRFSPRVDGWQQAHAEPVASASMWQSQVADEAELAALCDEAQRSLDLEQGPLIRAVLVTMADGAQRLLLVVHHLAVDGVSWRILLEDLQQAYRNAALPAKTSAYQVWAQQLQAHAQTLDDQLPYWQAQTASADLPCDNPQGGLQNRLGSKLEIRLTAEHTRQLLQDAPGAYRTQVNDLLLTALARVISRWSGQSATLIQLEGHGREDLFDTVDLSRTVGWFTSLFPVCLHAEGELSAAIKSVKEQLRAVPHKGIGYGLLRYLGTPDARETLSGLAAPRITFNYLGQFDRQFNESALFVPATQGSGQAQDPEAPLANWLTVEGQVYGGELALQWGFSREMFEVATVQRLAEDFQQELLALIAHCVDPKQGGLTPADVTLARLTQSQLDDLALPAREVQDLYPLSPMQQGMLFHSLYQQDEDDIYVSQLRADIHGLDVPRFQRAWEQVLGRHDMLRTGFVWQQGQTQPLQAVYRVAGLPFAEYDWQALPDQHAALDALSESTRAQGFVLEQAPLLSLKLVRTGVDRFHLIYTNHHILLDGWSRAQLFGEVLECYAGRPLPTLQGHYRDYIGWLQAQESAASEAFWKDQLVTMQEPTRLARGAGSNPSAAKGSYALALSIAQTDQLKGFAQTHKITLNTLVQAAWLLLLQRQTGQDTVVFGATVSGRPAGLPGVEQQVGLFINTLPVIATPSPMLWVGEWLQQVQALNLSLREHEHTPLFDIQRWAGTGGAALFDTLLVFENYPVSTALAAGAPAGLTFSHVQNFEQTHYPLTVLLGAGAALEFDFSFDVQSFGDDEIRQLAESFQHLLHGLTSVTPRRVGEVPSLTDAVRRQVVEGWNATQRDYPQGQWVHQLFEAQALAQPEAPALRFNETTLSYTELNSRANRLAHRLIEAGVGPDVLVGLAVERSVEMVVGLLAVLKAGGAYVPLDPEYPRERLAYMLEDSGVKLLLTQAHLLDQLPIPDGLESLVLGDSAFEAYSDANPGIALDGENLAYVIYTSGSTGQPKGAGNRHSALLNRLQWMQDAYGLDISDTVLQKTPFSFDVSVWEFFWPLMTGSRLVVAAPGDHRDPAKLVRLINAEHVTTLHFVPSMLQVFLQDPAVWSCQSLQRIVCSGEALPVDAQQQVFAKLPQAGLYNLYGPTEAAIDVTHWTCVDEGRDAVPIGRPIANLGCYILDSNFEPVPVGVLGELYLGGVGLARGYHRRPSLTAERFIAHPFIKGERLYRTGDLARYRENGVIEYAGRIDHQVKLRGLRIELGEIEARLLEHDWVREAAVLAVDSKYLVGYLVLHNAGDDWRDVLGTHLGQHLPDYMVPAQWVLLEQMPLSPNGKLDRKGLPKPEATHPYEAPQSALEQQIAAIWADVLGVEQVGLNDNFFERGGDSIISIQVVSRARAAGIHFTAKALFQHQTVRSLARVAQLQTAQVIDQGPVQGETPLLPFQQLFFEMDLPDRHHWNQSLLLTPRQPILAEPLEVALQALTRHHDVLRLSFSQQAEGWTARHDAQPATLLWQASVQDTTELQALCERAQRSLDLQQGPLLRAVLAEMADGSQRLLLVMHHLVVDGVSWRVFLEDLQSLYRQQPLPAKTTSFKAWAERLQAHARSAAIQPQKHFWLQQLQGVSTDLPCRDPRGARPGRLAQTVVSQLDAEHTRQLLQQAPTAYRTQINDLLLTALARVIRQWTGQASSLIQLEGHGREDLFDDIDLTRTLGWFTSLFPVRLTPAESLATSIKQIKEQLRAVPDKGLGFGALRYLGDEATRQAFSELPVPRITFNYLGQIDGSFDSPDVLFGPATESAGAEQSPDAPLGNWLTLNGQVFGGELHMGWTFSPLMFEASQIDALSQAFTRELKALVEHCCTPGNRGVTASDFPLSRLNQQQLESLPLAAEAIEDIYTLSPMQQGMLFHTLYEQAAGDYINQIRVTAEGLDVARFQQAWDATVRAHDVLRSGFFWEGQLEWPCQVVYREARLPIEHLDWRAMPERELALQNLQETQRRQGFDLAKAPLVRLVLVRTDEQRHELIYTHHHILMDGWSNSRLFGEVLQRYAGVAVPEAAGRYRDYIRWLQQRDGAATEPFWREQFSALQAPTRLGSSQPMAADGHGEHQLSLDRPLTDRLEAFARRNKVTLNTLIQAAWLVLLQRHSGQSVVAFGATVAGRPADLVGVEQQIGLFINTLPVICAVDGQHTVADWLQAVQAQNLALREHEHTGLYDIQRWAGQGGEALFDNILVFENYPVSKALEQSGGSGIRFGLPQSREQTSFPLTVLVDVGDTLSVQFSFARAHFDARTVQTYGRHLVNLLQAMLEGDQQRLGDLAMLDVAERQQVLQDWNATARDYPLQHCVHQRIEEQVARTPDAAALVFAEQRLSYAELNRRANRLAHRLIEAGVGPDVLVGLAVERSVEMVVGLLAVLKAGGAYVPLDPEYPRERLAYMLEDSGVKLLLTQAHLREQLPIPQGLEALVLGDSAFEAYSDANPGIALDGENLAYVIYTSGSTGQPKGAGNRHSALLNRLQWMQDAYGLDVSDTVLQKTPFSFDVSVWEFFWPLMTGSRLVVAAPGDHRDPAKLVRLINAEHVTTLHFVPSMLQAFLQDATVATCHTLHRIVCSGEALPVDAQQHVFAKLPQAGLYNLYGPTEAAIDVTHWTCVEEGRDAVPIGRPIANLGCYILDSNIEPVPVGVLGELYLGGIGLARGYHRRAALTAERFVAHPFIKGERLYRTGDLARYREDGVIEYAGRIDHQVKLRGLRIELGEVEARLLEHDWVREAAVLAVDGKYLVGYLVLHNAGDDWRDVLSAHLAQHLPDYMVPAQWMLLEQMPLSPNGKLDRKALPAVDANLQAREYVAPHSELEQQIAAIWAEVLEVERVGMHDNFFELGGHSLLATQVVVRLREQLHAEFDVKSIFTTPTLADFSAYVAARQTNNSPVQDALAKSLEALKRLSAEDLDKLIS